MSAKYKGAPKEKIKRYFLAKICLAGRGRSGIFPHKIKKNFVVSLREAAFMIRKQAKRYALEDLIR